MLWRLLKKASQRLVSHWLKQKMHSLTRHRNASQRLVSRWLKTHIKIRSPSWGRILLLLCLSLLVLQNLYLVLKYSKVFFNSSILQKTC
jgi:hypothetical protein